MADTTKLLTLGIDRIVLFDGVCVLCNGCMDFLLKNDVEERLTFGQMQSPQGQRLLSFLGIPMEDAMKQFVFVEGGHCYRGSSAALRIARHLRWPYPLLWMFLAVPPFIRNGVYGIVASNRYSWFGQLDACKKPSPELQARFIEYQELPNLS
uniref:Thiol-disulfide oxidoreductase DCC n=1 Tax=Eutreptiella gymnastica TaxID=73025 RepID=A0A7S1J8W5_9EUGL